MTRAPSARAPVTQADREAAAAWAKLNGRNHQAANIRRGSCDDAPIVQAFARHRIAALEEAARVAEALWRGELRRAAGKERSVPWSEVAEKDQETYRDSARAAIAALSLTTPARAVSREEVARTMAGYFCPFFDEIPKDKVDQRLARRYGDKFALLTDVTQEELLQAADAILALIGGGE